MPRTTDTPTELGLAMSEITRERGCATEADLLARGFTQTELAEYAEAARAVARRRLVKAGLTACTRAA